MNQHKLKELTPLFKEFEVSFETSSIEKYEIRSSDVSEVAKEAALQAFNTLGRPIVVDDTGLYIKALKGFPMAYPAFVLDSIGRSGILKLMEGISDRSAKFVTAVGFADKDENRVFLGEMSGFIANEEAGTGGFGYDPIFIPNTETRTYAQLSFDEKVGISHRTRAFRHFLKWYVNRI